MFENTWVPYRLVLESGNSVDTVFYTVCIQINVPLFYLEDVAHMKQVAQVSFERKCCSKLFWLNAQEMSRYKDVLSCFDSRPV